MQLVTRTAILPVGFVAIWSSGYVVGFLAAQDAPALAITFWRILAAGILIGLAGRIRGARWPRDARTVGSIALVGMLAFGVQFGGVYLGLSSGMPAATSALVVSCCPLLVAVLQAVFGHERLAATQWLGAALGLAGVVLALLSHLSRPDSFAPLAWTLLGLAGFAGATVLMPRLVPAESDARVVASIECLAACIVLGPWALLSGGVAVPLTAGAIGAATWLTLVNAVGGPVVLLALVRTRGATRASSLLFIVPAVTAIVSWPVLGQPIGVTTIVGLLVAGVGVTLVQRGRRPARATSVRPTSRPVASTMGG